MKIEAVSWEVTTDDGEDIGHIDRIYDDAGNRYVYDVELEGAYGETQLVESFEDALAYLDEETPSTSA